MKLLPYLDLHPRRAEFFEPVFVRSVEAYNLSNSAIKESFMPAAVIIINLALLFYSIGVWSERIQGRLKVWHTVFFWMGLVWDTWGTGLMMEMAGGLTSDIHGISGLLAIVLMLIHAVWATYVLWKRDEKMIVNFHKFSVFVWLVWLIPYFSPMLFGMANMP